MTQRYPDPPDAPWALLARHLAAETSAAERAELRAWVQADPVHLQVLATVTRAWERAGEAQAGPVLFTPADVEAAWQRFRPLMQAVAPPQAEEPAVAQAAPVGRPLRPGAVPAAPGWWQLAAALALLVGGSYLLTDGQFLRKRDAVTTYASAARRQLVRLPDGSRVWLNAHSRLHYRGLSTPASAGTRAVQLTGEAYFEVVPDPARPFLVSTATARVRVTGTAFNVRAYAAEDSVEVSVTRGRVWLLRLAAPDSVLLTADTRAALRAADAPGRVAAALRRTPTADHNFRAWQTDTLRFRDTPVAQVAHTLRATFGTAVTLLSAGLGKCRFTGTFARPQPHQVLAVLAAATASRLGPDGSGGYVLAGPGCAADTAAAGLTDSATLVAQP
ncbi:FecR family protein [Hymenobacter caeli]|uniref:Ferric-dicitrate binding protein FerR (Iron transport regulator) n=1 Tax=Hymenobacter caeli TaxID=2735894 RepID=A0ABX2FPL2_9BACT|nr:FecR domain-containing protein [Hymenobacter caeli]NRT18414.1 ferric-dicitrate binding protein FerR (iron transport regulator) [Hymenobacter caeli]